jgi:hypothetical protein
MAMLSTRVSWLLAGTAAAVAVVVGTLWTVNLDGPTTPDRDGTIEIVVDRYGFEPDQIAVPSDEPVTLRFINNNDFIYHLTIGRDQLETDGVPTGFEQDLFAGTTARAEPARAWRPPTEAFDAVTINLAEQATSTITVTLPKDRVGTWEAGCFVGRGCTAELQDAFTVVVE